MMVQLPGKTKILKHASSLRTTAYAAECKSACAAWRSSSFASEMGTKAPHSRVTRVSASCAGRAPPPSFLHSPRPPPFPPCKSKLSPRANCSASLTRNAPRFCRRRKACACGRVCGALRKRSSTSWCGLPRRPTRP